MSNAATRARLLPETISIGGSQWSISEDKHTRRPDCFPPSYCLIATTTKGVYAWDKDGVTELFRSGSGGIVAARKLTGHNEMLAIADSQVVILHDINKGMHRSYRLKGNEGQVRLLKYAGNLSKNLFFTTSLCNSVQSFSLTHSKMLDPSYSHPSPPSVFALSCTSHLLLSTSVSPPTIYLRNLGQNVPSILLRPCCSSSAVTAAGFHPEAANIFVLAFADGSVAVYNASLIFRGTDNGGRTERSTNSRTGGEIGSIKGLHAISSKKRKYLAEDGEWNTDPNGTSIQAEVSTIKAVALVSGQGATAVTVGADGKCCVVDFARSTRDKAVLLKSWHLRRPATSLSVLYTKAPAHLSDLDGAAERMGPANNDYCIAVGRQDGKVLLFDLGGKALGKQILDPKGALVVDVEWAKKETDTAFTQAGSSMPNSWKVVPKRKSLGTEVMKKNSSEHEVRAVQCENLGRPQDALFNFPRDSPASPNASSKAVKYLDLPHAVSPNVQNRADTRKPILSRLLDSDSSSLTLKSSTNSNSLVVDFSDSPPPVPPRPTPKPGGKLSQRRSTTAYKPQAQPNDIEPNKASNNRRETANGATPTKLPTLTTPPAKGTFFGPHSPPYLRAESWNRGPGECLKYVSPQATHDLPQGSNFQARPLRGSPASLEDVVTRFEPPIALSSSSPKSGPLSKLTQPSAARSSSASLRSYKDASSQFGQSETSTETVLDWSTASTSHRLDPSLHELSPVRTHTELSFLHGRPLKAISKEEERNNAKEECHGSTNVSTQRSALPLSSISQQSQDIAVADAALHWPSLRKSPRIADINAGVVSTTASVLDLGGYTDSTTPEKVLQEVNALPDQPKRQSSFSSRRDRSIPLRLPLKTSRSTSDLKGGSSTHVCLCEPHVQAAIAASLDIFRVEMAHGFEAQRLWLEELLKVGTGNKVKLEEENKLLRAEVARMEKRKERSE